jgi:thioredoxin 1
MKQINDDQFKEEVIDFKGKVLVDFWAPWCGPCRMIHPVLEQIKDESLKVVSINIDENPKQSNSHQVISIPNMFVYQDGKMVDQIVGALPKAQLQERLGLTDQDFKA